MCCARGADKNLAPGLVEWSDLGAGIAIIVGYLLLLQSAGFYLASWLAFTAIVMLYTASKSRQQTMRILWVSLGLYGSHLCAV